MRSDGAELNPVGMRPDQLARLGNHWRAGRETEQINLLEISNEYQRELIH